MIGLVSLASSFISSFLAKGQINSGEFYNQLRTHWSSEAGDRLQSAGWERNGKKSNFKKLSTSFLRILSTAPEDRDDVVAEEIDGLAAEKVATRGAFLSEMLCLRFPEEYPVLNKPIKDYLKDVEHRASHESSEGSRYIHLAVTLRSSLLQNPDYPAKNLAELDIILLESDKNNS